MLSIVLCLWGKEGRRSREEVEPLIAAHIAFIARFLPPTRTAENFRCLCTGEKKGKVNGKKQSLTYRGTLVDAPCACKKA